MCQGNDNAEASTNEFNAVRSKVFNFHSIRSVIIGKLRTKVVKNCNV